MFTAWTMDGPRSVEMDKTFMGFKDGIEQYGKLVGIQGSPRGAIAVLSVYDSDTGERYKMRLPFSQCWVEEN
jgi:hypothetical protein